MSNVTDWIAIIISIVAFGFSLFSFFKSNSLTKGQVEMQIRDMISSAKWRYADLGIQLSKDNQNQTLIASTKAALEDVANAYDEACMKYLDGKVDKARFKRAYINEIKNWVESDAVKDKYVMPQSKFHATVKVYNEWYNLEQ